jgi:hypothetical protein
MTTSSGDGVEGLCLARAAPFTLILGILALSKQKLESIWQILMG